ncbi:MAG: 2-oxoacid:acceptor oxidoreductase family protein, partial [Firmicutes bacterium]|nr:2-oxoacid:acceptor oxidoreductase family protein [Bacillota bacterium]
MATHKLMIAGFGGQGVLLIGQMIAYAAVKEGKEVTWMPSYGPEMRGGTANCTVVVSDKPIAAPLITEATAVVAMNGPSLDKFESMVIPGGDLFVNSSQPDCEAHRKDVNVHEVDLV